jgi:aspartate carbamoyltransferase catalytic subunit
MAVTELFDRFAASPGADPGLSDESELQLAPGGRLRHLLTLRGLDRQQITELLDRSETFLSGSCERVVRSLALAGRTVANLFFEPSTRPRASFDLAAKRLGADVLNLDVNT